MALLVGEAFFPSFGVLGIGGIVSLALGSLFLFDTQISDSGVDRSIVFTAVATVGSFVLAISYLVFRSQKSKPTLGMEGLIGEIGEARSQADADGQDFCPWRVLERRKRIGDVDERRKGRSGGL